MTDTLYARILYANGWCQVVRGEQIFKLQVVSIQVSITQIETSLPTYLCLGTLHIRSPYNFNWRVKTPSF